MHIGLHPGTQSSPQQGLITLCGCPPAVQQYPCDYVSLIMYLGIATAPYPHPLQHGCSTHSPPNYSMIDLLQSDETAQYFRIGTNSGSMLNHQDLCEKDSTDQLANLANPLSAISHVSINNILGRLHCIVP